MRKTTWVCIPLCWGRIGAPRSLSASQVYSAKPPLYVQKPNLKNFNRVAFSQKPVPIKRRLKSRNTKYNFKWNQPCLLSQIRPQFMSSNLSTLRENMSEVNFIWSVIIIDTSVNVFRNIYLDLQKCCDTIFYRIIYKS